MKKFFTEGQILTALKRATENRDIDRKSERCFEYLEEICEAPYGTLIVKAHPAIKFQGYDTYFLVSINIALSCLEESLFEPDKKESRKEAILMEIAHKLYLHAEEFEKEPLFYDDEDEIHQLDLSKFELNLDYAVSFTKMIDDKKDCAIFHIEQECGYSWLTLPDEYFQTPIYYKFDHLKKKVARKESI